MSSEFFHVLSAPYNPPQQVPPLQPTQPRPGHAQRCRATINWTPSAPTESTPSSSSSSHPPSLLDQPLYQPHGRWAWTHGLPIDDPKPLLSLRSTHFLLVFLHMVLIHLQRAPNVQLPSTAGLLLAKKSSTSAESKPSSVATPTRADMPLRWKMSKQKEWYGFYSEASRFHSLSTPRPTSLSLACPIQVGTIPPAPARGRSSPHHRCPRHARISEHHHGNAPLVVLDRILSEHARRTKGEGDCRIRKNPCTRRPSRRPRTTAYARWRGRQGHDHRLWDEQGGQGTPIRWPRESRARGI